MPMKHASLFFEIVAIMSCFFRNNPHKKKKEYVFFTFDSAKTPKRVVRVKKHRCDQVT